MPEFHGLIKISWLNGKMDIELAGNLSLDMVNLACDMVKADLLSRLQGRTSGLVQTTDMDERIKRAMEGK